jgi:hypothetical protein
MNKILISKLINENLNEYEKDYYKVYLDYMIENNFFDLIYYLKNKEKYFKYNCKNTNGTKLQKINNDRITINIYD